MYVFDLVKLASIAGIRNVFTFGDSYSKRPSLLSHKDLACNCGAATEGWNGSGDPLGSHPAQCFSAGPPWSRQFAQMTGTNLFNLAVSGATADQSIIFTSPLDFRGQTTAFLQQVANRVTWNSADSLFMVAFGTNDVNNSFRNLADNGTALYTRDLNSYFTTVDRLHAAGARNFVFNNLVPFDRAQVGTSQGPVLDAKMKASILEFNAILASKAATYCNSRTDITTCLIFDTHAVFTNLMDNFGSFGFATPDGICAPYANRFDCQVNPQADPSCLGPASAYIWKDALHPSFGADKFWAQELVNQLS